MRNFIKIIRNADTRFTGKYATACIRLASKTIQTHNKIGYPRLIVSQRKNVPPPYVKMPHSIPIQILASNYTRDCQIQTV